MKIPNIFDRRLKKKAAYQKCLCDATGNLTLAGQQVIKDLMQFCNVNTSTAFVSGDGYIDPTRMAFEEGRRTVFNRIKYYLTLSDAEILKAKELSNEL